MRAVLTGIAIALTIGGGARADDKPAWTQTSFRDGSQPAGCGWIRRSAIPKQPGAASLAVFVDRKDFALIFLSGTLPAKGTAIRAKDVLFGQVARTPDRVTIVADGVVAAIWSAPAAPLGDLGVSTIAQLSIVTDDKDYSVTADIVGVAGLLAGADSCQAGGGLILDPRDSSGLIAWLNNEPTAVATTTGNGTAMTGKGSKDGKAVALSAGAGVTAGGSAVSSGTSTTMPVVLTGAALYTALQTELDRLGCYHGRIDGDWGDRSRRALASYVRHSDSGELEPDAEALKVLKASATRVCPLVCGAREVARGGRCVAKTCPRGEVLDRRGRCREPAVRKTRTDRGGSERPHSASRGGNCGRVAAGRMCWRAVQEFFATYRCSGGKLGLVNTTRNLNYAMRFPHC